MHTWGKSYLLLPLAYPALHLKCPKRHSYLQHQHSIVESALQRQPCFRSPYQTVQKVAPENQNKSCLFSMQEVAYSGVGPWEEQAEAEHTQNGTANHPKDFQSHLKGSRVQWSHRKTGETCRCKTTTPCELACRTESPIRWVRKDMARHSRP